MTKYVALMSVHYTDEKDGERKVAIPRGQPVSGEKYHGVISGSFPAGEAERLLKLGAIRVATKEDLVAVDDVEDATIVEPKPVTEVFTAKHHGGGKYVVVNAGGDIVSGETRFDDKAAAEAWIAAKGSADADVIG